jgi:Meckel syndrome type 1 protein
MTQITPPPSDDDLPDERELAALYARLPKAEPDASLDAAVLAAATRAMPVNRRPRWPVAMASAAVLVLAVGVAWQVRELPPPATSTIPRAAAPAAIKGPTTDSLDGRVTESIAAEAAPTEAAPTGDLSKPRDAGPQASRASAASARAGADSSSARVGADSSAMPAQRAATHRAVAPAATAKAIRLEVSAPPAAAPVAAPAPLAPAAPAAPPEPYAPPAPPAPPAPAAAEAEPEAAIVSAAPAPVSSGLLMRKTVPTALGPDDRVGEIRRLLDRGDRTQALRELRDLRQRYPHYDLPQDLRDLNP